MGAICGWLGKGLENSQAVITGMLHAAKGLTQAENSLCTTENSAFGSRNHRDPPSILESEGLYTIIEGFPRWRDPELARLQKDRGPAYALAEGFKRHNKGVLDKLYGAFGLCIFRPKENWALLAIDRVGTQPMAFSLRNGTLVFGSQINQILAHPFITPEIDPQGIYNYLYFHMIPSPGSIYKNIEKLQPGEYLEFNKGKINRQFYWQLSYSEQHQPESTLALQLREELDKSVKICMSDQPTGTFLSGGLDSSTVTGVFQSLSREKTDAFAIGFNAEGFDEMEFARASAKHFAVRLHEYYVTPEDVLNAIPMIAASYDEPFGNASAIPAYYCAKFAREHGITCLLAGDGGDEIFAGNDRYAKQKLFDLYRHMPSILKSAVVEPLAFKLSPLRKLKSYIKQANTPMPERMETYNFLHRSPLEEIFSPDFLMQIEPNDPLRNLTSTYERSNADTLVKKMLFLDQKFTLADNDLRKVNRMCELAGVEVQYPLLQDNMIEFAARIPTNMLMRRLELRSFFRDALKGFLAKETLNKSKHGFGLPFGLWLNDHTQLKEFADTNLQNIRQRGILNKGYINNLIQAHQTGHASYYGVMIWILIMLEQWFQTHSSMAASK